MGPGNNLDTNATLGNCDGFSSISSFGAWLRGWRTSVNTVTFLCIRSSGNGGNVAVHVVMRVLELLLK